MSSRTKAAYFMTTPYVDAYSVAWEEDKQITYDEFVQKMKGQAYQWGESSIGRVVLMGYEMPMYNGEHVLAFGQYDGTPYVAVHTGADLAIHEVEDKGIGDDWDVT